MTNRTTIYLGEPLQRLLEASGRENRSGRINCMAECYNTIIQDELLHLDLSPTEWCAICDANNPGWGVYSLGDALTSANFAWANVADTEGIGAKWEIDDKALIEKMRAMRPAQRIAVYEVVSRFWDHPKLNALTRDELLRDAGAIFADSIIRKQLAASLRMEPAT